MAVCRFLYLDLLCGFEEYPGIAGGSGQDRRGDFLQIAFRIKLPLIMEVIKVTIVLAVVGSLKYFDLIFVMTDGA